MKRPFIFTRPYWFRFSKIADQQIHGGDWADAQPAAIRHNLKWFWFDGVLSSASENIIITYLALYVLALGASSAQIGWLSSLSSLSATIMLIPGALLVERIGRRKQIILLSGGVAARLVILLLVVTPWCFAGAGVVSIAIAFAVLRDGLNNLSLPAWVSLTADIVPLSWRGRYFGLRNIYMSIAGMASILVVGEIITRSDKPLGYQVALALAFGVGMLSTYSYAHLREIRQPSISRSAKQSAVSPLGILRALWASPVLLAVSLTSALWNFSLNIAGPFFNVYMVQHLFATPTMVGFLSIVSSLSGLPAQRILGPLADRWGPRRIMMVTGFIIPVLPFSWLFINAPWQIIPVNLLGGFIWGGYSLAVFNLLLELTPQELRARTTALYQVIVSVSLAAGAALGGVLVTQSGFKAVFLASAIGRFIAAVLFARFVTLQKPSVDIESPVA